MRTRSSSHLIAESSTTPKHRNRRRSKQRVELFSLEETPEVIKNGNKVIKRTVGETEQEYEPTTAEEKPDRRNEMKARGTMFMALPNKDQRKFHSYKDAKLLMEAIEKRYEGNKESKKVQRTLLKQQYENFAGSSSETMDQAFDRLQKLITQLEIQGEVITQEDMNLKLLRSLPSEWKTYALIWRNKQEIETIIFYDLYNNLKIYKPEISGSSSTSQNPQNVAFVSSNSTNSNSSTNEADNTAYGVSATHTQSNPTSGDNLSDVQKEYKENGVIDSGYSSHLTGNKCYLTEYEYYDGRFVSFGDGKGRIFGKASPVVESFVNSSEMLENQEYNKSKSDKGYHVVPPPIQGTSFPPNLI
ncbi:hypothetical protein Tco_0685483 [Tanacetum coccineum]